MSRLIKFGIINLFSALLITFQSLNAQPWEWVKTISTSGKCKAYGITSDNEGNIVVAGSFTGTVTFNTTKFISYGLNDMFVSKYTADGELLWARQGGGTKNEEAYGVACDRHGNVFIIGYFSGFLNLDNIALGSGVGVEDRNCVVVKYDKDGSLQWAVRSSGEGDKYGKAITIDKDENILITGGFKNEMSFQFEDHSKKHLTEEEEESKVLKSKGASNIFIAKVASNSDFLWIEQSDGDGINEPSAIESDHNGNCYVTGAFSGTCNFSDKKFTSKGGKDIFVAKYDPAGKVIWVKQSGSSKDDQSSGIARDTSGCIYLTGYFQESIRFGKIKLKNKSNDNIFVAKMDNYGNTLWAKQAGGTGNEYTKGIKSDSKGNVFVTGEFNTDFDFANSKISSSGDWDVFLLAFNNQGTMIKGYQAGGKGADKGIGVTVNANDNCFILGRIGQEAHFGDINIKNNGDSDIFIARIKK